MWNKQRRDEEPARSFTPSLSPIPPAASPAEPKKEAVTVSSLPTRSFEPERSGGSATIGKAVKINGQIHYGWAQVDIDAGFGVTTGSLDVTLIDYAYETVAGKSIKAGQKTGP